MSGAGKNPLVGVRASIYERRGKDETFLMTVEILDVNPGRLWAQVVVVPKPPSSLIVATNEQTRHRIGDLVEVQTGAAWRISLTEHPEAP